MDAKTALYSITAHAASIANQRVRTEQLPAWGINIHPEATIFIPQPWAGGYEPGPFFIEIAPGVSNLLTADQLTELKSVAADSVARAINEKKPLFVGVIVGYLKEGINFFDYCK